MDVIGLMTREEMVRVEEEAQTLLRSADMSQFTAQRGEARLEFYPAEVLGSGRKRSTKKKAELSAVHDGIGITSQPVDIKLDNVETSVNIHVVDPNEFVTQLNQTIASGCVTAGATSGVNNLRVISIIDGTVVVPQEQGRGEG
ncbi:hypothetical protein AAVH_43521 [Aphelenchoides avenae]|nr:hypothetical protein AAVH_43521 [Aphelenchus avenae]